MARIGLLGGESTGKSTLAQALAEALPACLVQESLRAFVVAHGRPPERHEQAVLMARQADAEEAVARSCPLATVVADPAPLMTAVYSELYFGDDRLLPAGIEHATGYRLVVWCAPDQPWTADDGHRDGPAFRAAADDLIARVVRDDLEPRGIDVLRVHGSVADRVATVRRAWQLRAPDRPT